MSLPPPFPLSPSLSGHGDSCAGEGGKWDCMQRVVTYPHAESGESTGQEVALSCRVPVSTPPPPLQSPVEVLTVIRVEDEVPAAYSGDNIKLKLKGIEEEV